MRRRGTRRVGGMSADAFLRDIREHPDDDAVRLIYADWLEEHARTEADRARAELIRVQCRLTAGGADVAERLALEVRQRALAAAPVAPRLERLGFHSCLLEQDALAALADGRFERLRSLDLRGSDPGAGGLRTLGAAAFPPKLTALRLDDWGPPSAAPLLA